MKRILILEDEARNANRLIRLLKGIVPDARIDGPLASIESAIAYLHETGPIDLIISDIRLSDGLSFEALKEADTAIPILFTTAFDEYAVQAFKYNSVDYLLKPVDAEELAAAIAKVRRGPPAYRKISCCNFSMPSIPPISTTGNGSCCLFGTATKPYRSKTSTISSSRTKPPDFI